MQLTTNFGLKKPEANEYYNVEDFNSNAEIIDNELKKAQDAAGSHAARHAAGGEDSITPEDIGAAAASHGTHVAFSSTAPVVAGTAAVGSATTVARSDHVHPAQTTVSGNAGSATKLATARTIRTNLASTSAASFNGTANVTPGVTGTLPIANGGTGSTTAAAALTALGAAAASHGTHVTFSTDAPVVAGTAAVGSATTVARSDHVHPAQTTVSGNAGSATKLATARTIRTNLASTSTASFNGTANVTPGVTGTLPVANGGTGVTSNPSMLTNLGSTTAASVFAASPRPGVTGTLPIANGGTGSTTAAAALTALGAAAASHTHAATDITGLTSVLSSYSKIATGSYTGTGTYGSNNPCSLTFDFVPKMVIVMQTKYGNSESLLWVGQPGSDSSANYCQKFTLSSKTLKWYSTSSASTQANVSSLEYYWLALG